MSEMHLKVGGFFVVLGLLIASPSYADSVHTTIKKIAKSDLKTYKVLRRRIRKKEHPCGIGILGSWYSVITRVSSEGSSNGLRPGDEILAVDGAGFNIDEALVRIPEHFSAGEKLTISILRDKSKLDLDVLCADGTERLQAVFSLLRSAAKGKWQQCIDQSYLVDEINGGESAANGLYRVSCNEAVRCGRKGCEYPGTEDAELNYQYILLILEEALLVRDGLERIRPSVLEAIDWLEDNGFDQLAGDLEVRLEKTVSASLPSLPVTKQGTCFAVSDREILASQQVVSDARFVTVTFQEGREIWADVKQQNLSSDLALLVIYENAPAMLSLTAAAPPSVGERVFTPEFPAAGAPGQESTFIEGSVTLLAEEQGGARYLQTSLPVKPGNAGSPVLNMRGEAVGVLAAGIAVESLHKQAGTLPQGVSWAVESAYARMLFDLPTRDAKAASKVETLKQARSALCRVRAVLEGL